MIKFNVVDEFLDELVKDLALIERKIVHATNMYQQSATVPVIQHVSVVATCKIAGEIVRLDANVGTVMRLESYQHAHQRAEKIQEQMTTFCNQHGLEVQAGIYE